MSYRITTYKDAFEGVLGIKFDEKLQAFVKTLEEEGHTEKSISYSIWRSQEKLSKFKHDARFLGVLKNEILKYSWPKGDPRWNNYWKKKNEEERVRKIQQQQLAQRKKELYPKTNKKQGCVYFIQGENGGAIKIGYSKNPEERLKQLQTGYPDILKILCLIPATNKTEGFYHKKYEDLKLNGEWYKPDRRILNDIKKLKFKYNQNDL